ncbi:hypothetical protein B566_EDAN010948, partial [Ephemera danica]
MSAKMYQTLKMLLLLSAVLQIIAVEASEEQKANLEVLLSDQDSQIRFFKQNKSLWKQAEAEYREEIIQLNAKLQDNEENTGKLAVNNSELMQ